MKPGIPESSIPYMKSTHSLTALERVLVYHERTKHHLDRYARALGYLDWDTQPDPFRRYDGAEILLLEEVPPTPDPFYDTIFWPGATEPRPVNQAPPPTLPRRISARQIIRQRRSAVAMDGKTRLDRETFYGMLERVLPKPCRVPFSSLPWKPAIHLVLFVHRVDGLDPGIYCFVRDPDAIDDLKAALHSGFEWSRSSGCPDDLPLYRLVQADCRNEAQIVSCHQAIASDGVFALAMIAQFTPCLEDWGTWFYKRLHWEAGAIGQVLYLEAEAAGVGSTGIGCFFDDALHQVVGLANHRYQDLYHFTVGGPVLDSRLRTTPAYAHRGDPQLGVGQDRQTKYQS